MPSIYYDVHVERVELHPVWKHQVIRSWYTGGLMCQIPGHEEIDLLFHLTSPKSAFHKMMMKQADGQYRMKVWKEAMTSYYRRIHGKKHGIKSEPRFKWHGWMLFNKRKDDIAINNRWFQVGSMNPYNLDVEPRDIQREVKNTNWNRVPGGGLSRPFAWDKSREDDFSENTKSRLRNVY